MLLPHILFPTDTERAKYSLPALFLSERWAIVCASAPAQWIEHIDFLPYIHLRFMRMYVQFDCDWNKPGGGWAVGGVSKAKIGSERGGTTHNIFINPKVNRIIPQDEVFLFPKRFHVELPFLPKTFLFPNLWTLFTKCCTRRKISIDTLRYF